MNHAINVTDSDGNTAQHLACREGNVTCIHQLIRYGADVDARDSEAAATQPCFKAIKTQEFQEDLNSLMIWSDK